MVDGSPDRCLAMLREALPHAGFRARLLCLSRNFGSFSAVVAGLEVARGPLFGVMAADLQEPAELVLAFQKKLASEECSVVIGIRKSRTDPWLSKLLSGLFWRTYRTFVQKEVPAGGVDVFGCNREFRDALVAFRERNTTLIGLLFWLGFPRAEVEYERLPRPAGESAWTFGRRIRYLMDSSFAFSDLPIRFISGAGLLGLLISVVLGLLVLVARVSGDIPVPGYAATIIAVMFFGGLNSLSIGLLGEYLWRAFENTKGRPLFVVARDLSFAPGNTVKNPNIVE